MGKCIKTNFEILFKRKNFWLVLLLMLVVAIGIYVVDLYKYAGYNIDNVPDANSLFYLDCIRNYSTYILTVFPILATIPFADIHAKDCVNGTNLLCVMRTKRRQWYYAQALVVFLGTFIALFVPSMLNLILNNITFPDNGLYEMSGFEYSEFYFGSIQGTNWVKETLQKGWLLRGIMYQSPFLYNTLAILLFSVTGGVLAYFAYGISMALGKGRIYIYFIPFVIIQLIGAFDAYVYYYSKVYVCCNLATYLSTGLGRVGCFYPAFYGFLLILVLVATIFIEKKVRQSEL